MTDKVAGVEIAGLEIDTPCNVVRYFLVLHLPVLHFPSPQQNM